MTTIFREGRFAHKTTWEIGKIPILNLDGAMEIQTCNLKMSRTKSQLNYASATLTKLSSED